MEDPNIYYGLALQLQTSESSPLFDSSLVKDLNMLLSPTFTLLLVKLAFAATDQSKDDFNMYQGPAIQAQHADDPASDLTFTLTGGQPCVLSQSTTCPCHIEPLP